MATVDTLNVRVRTRPGFVALLWASVVLDRAGLERMSDGCWRLAKLLIRVEPVRG